MLRFSEIDKDSPRSEFEFNDEAYALVNSPDDGGYYVERISDFAVSQVFAETDELWRSLVDDELEWEYYE